MPLSLLTRWHAKEQVFGIIGTREGLLRFAEQVTEMANRDIDSDTRLHLYFGVAGAPGLFVVRLDNLGTHVLIERGGVPIPMPKRPDGQ